jgi:hypothetical protein
MQTSKHEKSAEWPEVFLERKRLLYHKLNTKA